VVGVSLVVAAVSLGLLIFALISRGQAIGASNTALARELGAEAVNQPRIDVAMLLAREAVNLDRSPQTESTLLATLLRGPAVIGTIPLPSETTAALAFSPDGHTLAAIDGLGELRLFDARVHTLSAVPLVSVSTNQPAAYSQDGTLLAVRSTGGLGTTFIVVCDTRSLQTVATLPVPVNAPPSPSDIPSGSIVIAPDHRTVYYAYWVVGTHGAPQSAYVQRWASPSGDVLPLTRVGSGALFAIRLIDGGSRMMIVGTRSVSVFNARSMKLVSTVDMSPAPVAPTAASISPDGRTVVIGSQSGTVSFLDTETGQLRTAVEAQHAPIASVVYPRDDRTVASVASDDSVIVWDPIRHKPKQLLSGPSGHVAGAAISPDGSTLYTAVNGVLLQWDLTGVGFGHRFTAGSPLSCCDPALPRAPPFALSPDGSTFAVRLRPSTVGLFSSDTMRLRTSLTIGHGGNVVTALAWSPAGRELAVAGHSGLVQLWRTDGQPRLAHTLAGLQSKFGEPEAIQAVAFSSDGSLVAASDDDKIESTGGTTSNADYASLAIWSAASGRLVASPTGLNAQGGHGVEPFAGDDLLAFSPGGRRLAMSLFDLSVVIFDASNGDVVQAWASDTPTTSLAFAPDGTLAVGTAVGTVEFWNPATGSRIGSPLVVGAAAVTNIAFDSSGRRFVTAGLGEGAVKLWFTATSQQEGPAFSTDQGATATALFGRDGTSLLAVDDAGNGFSWPTSLASWEQRACGVAGRNLSRQEWSQLVGGQSYASVCP
jgi:WD40 repeat protein